MSRNLSLIAIFFLLLGLFALLIIARIIWRRCSGSTVSEPTRRGWIRRVESVLMVPYAMLARAEVVVNQEQQEAQSWVEVSPTPMTVNAEYNSAEEEPQHLIVHFGHTAPSTPTVIEEAPSVIMWPITANSTTDGSQLRSYTTGNSGTLVSIAHQVLHTTIP